MQPELSPAGGNTLSEFLFPVLYVMASMNCLPMSFLEHSEMGNPALTGLHGYFRDPTPELPKFPAVSFRHLNGTINNGEHEHIWHVTRLLWSFS
ncbi:Uncharacterised protein [Salmonella enterica subsp. arizonae]|uniref:Uncharacterized protein n=1 Tax=Salmonella enterica subsp. arizonae TaxID=59203 RepID=A0A379SQW7_SALER|nr:Uncharacterised protein [Salmonella enterica subsp. arizonae]